MSFLGDYASIKQQLFSAVSSALSDMAQEVLDELKKTAETVVYSYEATEQAMETRRGTIADKPQFEIEYGEDYVTIKNVAKMQGTDYGVPEIEFVEEGYESYRQPGPRAFMEKTRDEYISSGKADRRLAKTMAAHGFDAALTTIGE